MPTFDYDFSPNDTVWFIDRDNKCVDTGTVLQVTYNVVLRLDENNEEYLDDELDYWIINSNSLTFKKSRGDVFGSSAEALLEIADILAES
jgi:hypothetical protein